MTKEKTRAIAEVSRLRESCKEARSIMDNPRCGLDTYYRLEESLTEWKSAIRDVRRNWGI